MKKMIFISIIIILLNIFIVNSLTINTFTTGNIATNLTWTKAGNKTLYINVSSEANITEAEIDLKGYLLTGNYIPQNDYVFLKNETDGTNGWVNWVNKSNKYIVSGADCGEKYEITYNLTLLSNPKNITFRRSVTTAGYLNWEFFNTSMSIYNYTSSSYKNVYNNLIDFGSQVQCYCSILTWTVVLTDDYYNGDIITVKLKTNAIDNYPISEQGGTCPGGATQKCDGELYSTSMYINFTASIQSYLINLTIDTGNDGSLDYTNYSTFNSTTTIDLNTTAMNNWIKSNCLTGWCNLPVIFSSVITGILQYSNLEINYTYNYSVDYENDVLETSTDNFILQFIGIPSTWNTTANLFYNSTEYATTKITTGTSINFSTELQIPTITANSTNISLYWNYTINTEKANTTIYNQTVYKLVLTDCTSLTTQGAYNFTIKNQSNNLALSGSNLDIAFDYVKPTNSTKIYNYSFSKTNISSQQFCIYPTWATGRVNATLEYGKTGFSNHNYYLYNSTLNNVSNNITLYLSPGTTKVTFSVIDENDNDVFDCYIKIQKYNVGTNTYDLVQIIKTDTYGNAIGEIILNDVWYMYTLEKAGATLLITSGMKQTLTTRTFRVNFRSDYLDNYDVRMGIISSLTFNNATKNFAFTYSDPTNTIHRGCLKVVQMGAKNEVLINNTCSETAAGTVLVNIGTNTGTNTYRATGYVNFDDKMTLNTLIKTFQERFKEWGVDGLWYSFILISSVTMLGMWNPVAGLGFFALVLGLAAWPSFGLIQIGWEYLIAFFVLTGLTMWKVSKR